LIIIAIEGLDGCGKTTQANMLVTRLKATGYKAIYVRPIFILINIFKKPKSDGSIFVSPRKTRTYKASTLGSKESILYIKKYLMYVLGYPYALLTYLYMKYHLCKNNIVICDRYFYQFFYDLYGEWAEYIIRFFPKSDFTFFLDGELDLFYSRMDDLWDTSVDKKYYIKVLSLYRQASKRYNFIEIDASLDEKLINRSILSYLIESSYLR